MRSEVTPNCAEVIVAALVEAISGEAIDRHTQPETALAA
jgi:DNA (cytosine-5)-methyltransferase 1